MTICHLCVTDLHRCFGDTYLVTCISDTDVLSSDKLNVAMPWRLH